MRAAMFAGLALAAVGPALAEGLSAREARGAFFGLDMTGYLSGDNTKWRECVRPSGETSYWFGGSYDQGRLRIRDDGALCFSYKSTGYAREACFHAERQGSNWKFTDENDPATIFLTTQTRRVNACPTNEAPIS